MLSFFGGRRESRCFLPRSPVQTGAGLPPYRDRTSSPTVARSSSPLPSRVTWVLGMADLSPLLVFPCRLGSCTSLASQPCSIKPRRHRLAANQATAFPTGVRAWTRPDPCPTGWPLLFAPSTAHETQSSPPARALPEAKLAHTNLMRAGWDEFRNRHSSLQPCSLSGTRI